MKNNAHRTLVALACLLLIASVRGEEARPDLDKEFAEKFWPAVSLPHRRAVLSSKLDEKVQAVAVKEGQRVKAGEVLVEFDGRLIQARIAVAETAADFEARLKSAQARSEYLEIEFQRSKKLGRFITPSDLDKACYETQIAKLDVEELQRSKLLADRQLAYLRAEAEDYVLRSPLDGVVSRVEIKPAEMARQGQQIVEVIDPALIEMRVHLPERFAAKLTRGQKAVVKFCPPADQEFTGTVDVVSPSVDSSSGTFLVKVLVEPRQESIKPGMGCQVRFLPPS